MKIDLVYLWVNSSDEAWQSKKSQYSMSGYDKEAISTCRFIDNEELKYSLRSVEKYASWVNKIFIVTDNQVPVWLNINHPKIKIINHKEIIPEDKLPLFNSCAIETRLPFIPDLSEYFLYANDDTMFWDYVEPEFFFEDGKPICRFHKVISKKKQRTMLYGYTIQRAYDILSKKYHLNFKPAFPHHNIDIYKKSSFLSCINEFPNEFAETLNHRFREFSDLERVIVSYYMLAKGDGVEKFIRLNWFDRVVLKKQADARCFSVKQSCIPKIMKANTKLICLNDTCDTTPDARLEVKKILNSKFPDKSTFEK